MFELAKALERGIIGGVKSAHPIAPAPLADAFYVVVGTRTHNKNGHDYSWDNENRLGTATVPVAPEGQSQIGIPGTHTYAYDALGRRVSKTVNGVTTTYINNADWQEIAEYQGANLVQSYVYGSYIDEVLCMVKSNGDRFFYSTNDLYSVYALTDGDGTVVERCCYDPYGAVTIWDGNAQTQRAESAYGNPWTWQSRRLDSETGLMYFRTRAYESSLGRFLNRNPWGYIHDFMTLYDVENNRPPQSLEPFSWVTTGTREEIVSVENQRREVFDHYVYRTIEGCCYEFKVIRIEMRTVTVKNTIAMQERDNWAAGASKAANLIAGSEGAASVYAFSKGPLGWGAGVFLGIGSGIMWAGSQGLDYLGETEHREVVKGKTVEATEYETMGTMEDPVYKVMVKKEKCQ